MAKTPCVYIAGELESWPTMNEMAALLRSAGLAVIEGRYSLRLADFDHFILQQYGGDIGDPHIDFEHYSLDDMLRDSGRVSKIFAAANLRHRFEIYDDADQMIGYLHHDWPDELIADHGIDCPIAMESPSANESGGSTMFRRFGQSVGRVIVATLIAVPSTLLLATVLLLVPPNVAIGICFIGMVFFYAGRGLDRPILVGFGGVTMFAGLLSWAVRQ